MAAKKKSRKDDFLAGHGMSPAQQHATEMNAAAVPVSELEGYYPSYDTSNTASGRLLSKVMFESRMRKEMPEEGKNNFIWNVED